MNHERLLDLIQYDAASGLCWWRADGTLVGYVDGKYLRAVIDGRQYWLHRVIFFYVTGRWPYHVDHIDTEGLNNRWENLRDANKSQNGQNRGVPRNNKVGLKGASLCGMTGRWRASIRAESRSINLGRYDTAEEAHTAYVTAAKKYFGEFARGA